MADLTYERDVLTQAGEWQDLQVALEDLTPEEREAFEAELASGALARLVLPWEPWWRSAEAQRLSLRRAGTRLIQDAGGMPSGRPLRHLLTMLSSASHPARTQPQALSSAVKSPSETPSLMLPVGQRCVKAIAVRCPVRSGSVAAGLRAWTSDGCGLPVQIVTVICKRRGPFQTRLRACCPAWVR